MSMNTLCYRDALFHVYQLEQLGRTSPVILLRHASSPYTQTDICHAYDRLVKAGYLTRTENHFQLTESGKCALTQLRQNIITPEIASKLHVSFYRRHLVARIGQKL